jgi:hypothetical protein
MFINSLSLVLSEVISRVMFNLWHTGAAAEEVVCSASSCVRLPSSLSYEVRSPFILAHPCFLFVLWPCDPLFFPCRRAPDSSADTSQDITLLCSVEI